MSVATEKHYSIAEVAELWGLSWTTVKRMIEGEHGILTFGNPGSAKRKPYQTIRIPESVLQRLHTRLRS
jgi:hypothetical protein